MLAKDLMTPEPACCMSDTPLRDVARLMVDNDCGEIPVVDEDRKVLGVITDRDITCRAVAAGRNPLELKASDCMTSPAVTVTLETSVDDCCKTMEDKQIRRVPVVDEQECCCGMVSQADVARHASEENTAAVVKEISQPTSSSW
jgi:CBS domain-containing protein